MSALELIYDNVELSELFTTEFKEVLDELNEPYFEPLPATQVIGTFRGQGFYSGARYRIYWTLREGFTVEEKRYG